MNLFDFSKLNYKVMSKTVDKLSWEGNNSQIIKNTLIENDYKNVLQYTKHHSIITEVDINDSYSRTFCNILTRRSSFHDFTNNRDNYSELLGLKDDGTCQRWSNDSTLIKSNNKILFPLNDDSIQAKMLNDFINKPVIESKITNGLNKIITDYIVCPHNILIMKENCCLCLFKYGNILLEIMNV